MGVDLYAKFHSSDSADSEKDIQLPYETTITLIKIIYNIEITHDHIDEVAQYSKRAPSYFDFEAYDVWWENKPFMYDAIESIGVQPYCCLGGCKRVMPIIVGQMGYEYDSGSTKNPNEIRIILENLFLHRGDRLSQLITEVYWS